MPLRTEYSCRLREPEEFQKKSFRRIASGDVDLIIARPHGMTKTRAQAIRYPRELWDEKDAKRSCKKRQGKFEPVSKLGQIPPPLLLKKRRKTKTKPRLLPPDAQLEVEKLGREMGLTRKQIEVAIKEGVTSPLGMRRIAKNVPETIAPKSKPLPPDAQNIKELSFNSDQFTCYGKQTGRGFRAYCRRK